MGLFKRSPGRSTVADSPVPASTEGLFEEIRRLSAANRSRANRDTERRLLRLRHLAGVRLLEESRREDYPEPAATLPEADGLPEFVPSELTPELMRAAILRDGCVLVRGLVPRAVAQALARDVDRVFTARAKAAAGRRSAPGYYEEFAEAKFLEAFRPWIHELGGILAADSPRVAARMLEVFGDAGLEALVGGYLGERPLLSVHKTTLRKAHPTVGGSWHQDGAFMGGARALNLWLSLSRCGDEAPGLDLVPRRFEEIVVAHDDMLDVGVTQAKARAAAGDVPILRPIFEPGDALLFDEMFLHQTGSDASMRKPRFAIESWFFGGSAFPRDYAPIAL